MHVNQMPHRSVSCSRSADVDPCSPVELCFAVLLPVPLPPLLHPQQAKQLGNDIAAKQRDAEVTEQQIDAARVAYQPCGEYTSLLFFCISDLAAIDPMYQYSLPWYTKLFVASVHAAEAADDVPTRLEHIHAHFTYSLYKNICWWVACSMLGCCCRGGFCVTKYHLQQQGQRAVGNAWHAYGPCLVMQHFDA